MMEDVKYVKLQKQVDIYLSSNRAPSYFGLISLRKAQQRHPDDERLAKLISQIETKSKRAHAAISPKKLYLVLFPAIGVIGLVQILAWLTSEANILGLVYGMLCFIGAYLIYKQYTREL